MNGSKSGPLLILLLAGFTTSNPAPVNQTPQEWDSDNLANYYYDAPHPEYMDGAAVASITPAQKTKAILRLYDLLRALQDEEGASDDIPVPAGGFPVADRGVGTAEAGDAVLGPAGDHSVEKRRRKSIYSYVYRPNQPLKRCLGCRRYGFWVTAINKMDNGHLKGFLGKHRNIYNVYKRNAHPLAFPRMH